MRQGGDQHEGDGGVEKELRRVESHHGARQGLVHHHAHLTHAQTQHRQGRRHLPVEPAGVWRAWLGKREGKHMELQIAENIMQVLEGIERLLKENMKEKIR